MTKPSSEKCLLDTNILVAVAIKDSPYFAKARDLFDQVKKGEIKAVISSQNILEFSSVLINYYKFPRQEVRKLAKTLRCALTPEKIFPNLSTLVIFEKLLTQNPTVHTTDLFLAATALANNVMVIATGDRDFEKIKGIKVYNPLA